MADNTIDKKKPSSENQNKPANTNYSYFYSELNPSGTPKRAKRAKEAWRWIKYIIFGFLLITTIWGCVNGFTLQTSDQGGWGFEIYADWTKNAQDNIYPNAYQVSPIASARSNSVKYNTDGTKYEISANNAADFKYNEAYDYSFTTDAEVGEPITDQTVMKISEQTKINSIDNYWFTSVPTIDVDFSNAFTFGVSTTSSPVAYVWKGDTDVNGTIVPNGPDGKSYMDGDEFTKDDEGWILNHPFNATYTAATVPTGYTHSKDKFPTPKSFEDALLVQSTAGEDTDGNGTGDQTQEYKDYQAYKKERVDNYAWYQQYSGVSMVGPNTVIWYDADDNGEFNRDATTPEEATDYWAYAWEFAGNDGTLINAFAANGDDTSAGVFEPYHITSQLFTGSTVKYQARFVESQPYKKGESSNTLLDSTLIGETSIEAARLADIDDSNESTRIYFQTYVPSDSPLLANAQPNAPNTSNIALDANGNYYFKDHFTLPASDFALSSKSFSNTTGTASDPAGAEIAYETAFVLVPYNKDNRVNLSDQALNDTADIRNEQTTTANPNWVEDSSSPRGVEEDNNSSVSQSGFTFVEPGIDSNGDYVDDKGTYTTEDDEVLTEEDDAYFGGTYDLAKWNQFDATNAVDAKGEEVDATEADVKPIDKFMYFMDLSTFSGFLLQYAAENHLNGNSVSGTDPIGPAANIYDPAITEIELTQQQFSDSFDGSWTDFRTNSLFAYANNIGAKQMAVEVSTSQVGEFDANHIFVPQDKTMYAMVSPQSLIGINSQGESFGTNIVSNAGGSPRDTAAIAAYEGKTNIYSNRHILANWNDAWTYGPFIAIFVYPIAMVSYAFNSMLPVWEYGGLSVFFGILFIVILLRSLATAVSFRQTRQTQKMQEIQIKVAAINAKYDKYGDNKDMKRRKQMETMALYKKEDINPLGSLAQIVVTMPLFLAIWKIISALPIYKMHNIGPISATVTPLGGIFAGGWAMLAYGTLLGLVIGTQFVSFKLGQWLSQKRKNVKRMDDATKAQYKRNNRIANWMLVFYVIMSITIPSLLAIYWVLSGSFSIGMTWVQHWITLSHAKKTKSRTKSSSHQTILDSSKSFVPVAA